MVATTIYDCKYTTNIKSYATIHNHLAKIKGKLANDSRPPSPKGWTFDSRGRQPTDEQQKDFSTPIGVDYQSFVDLL
jgi:hypothetical protein